VTAATLAVALTAWIVPGQATAGASFLDASTPAAAIYPSPSVAMDLPRGVFSAGADTSLRLAFRQGPRNPGGRGDAEPRP
jgi:hypothetical protein